MIPLPMRRRQRALGRKPPCVSGATCTQRGPRDGPSRGFLTCSSSHFNMACSSRRVWQNSFDVVQWYMIPVRMQPANDNFPCHTTGIRAFAHGPSNSKGARHHQRYPQSPRRMLLNMTCRPPNGALTRNDGGPSGGVVNPYSAMDTRPEHCKTNWAILILARTRSERTKREQMAPLHPRSRKHPWKNWPRRFAPNYGTSYTSWFDIWCIMEP